jgi:hypothetical protein
MHYLYVQGVLEITKRGQRKESEETECFCVAFEVMAAMKVSVVFLWVVRLCGLTCVTSGRRNYHLLFSEVRWRGYEAEGRHNPQDQNRQNDFMLLMNVSLQLFYFLLLRFLQRTTELYEYVYCKLSVLLGRDCACPFLIYLTLASYVHSTVSR